MNTTNTTLAEKILTSGVEFGKNSDWLSNAMSGSFHFFLEHPITIILVIIAVALLASGGISYLMDLGETSGQSVIWAGTVYFLVVLVTFSILLFLDMGEVAFMAGLN